MCVEKIFRGNEEYFKCPGRRRCVNYVGVCCELSRQRVWKSIKGEIGSGFIATEVHVRCLLLVSRSCIDSICILRKAAEKFSSGDRELHLIFIDPKNLMQSPT